MKKYILNDIKFDPTPITLFSKEVENMVSQQDLKKAMDNNRELLNRVLGSDFNMSMPVDLINMYAENPLVNQPYGGVDEISDTVKEVQDSISADTVFLSEYSNYYKKWIRENENLNRQELKDKYIKDYNQSKTLGENGWVVPTFSNERVISEWYGYIKKKQNDKILSSYLDNEKAETRGIISRLKEIYVYKPTDVYFDRGCEAYYNGDYMTSALYLLGLLDYRVRKAFPIKDSEKPHVNNKDKFCEKGFRDSIDDDHKGLDFGVVKKTIEIDMYPSLIYFLRRLFVEDDEHRLGKKEPQYMNRNWLMHGDSCRDIGEMDCIQVLNALDVIEFIAKRRNFTKNNRE